MVSLVLIGVGGGLGAIARHIVNQLTIASFGSSLWGTFLANTSGSLLLGLLLGLFSTDPGWPIETRLFMAVGFLGSYTTFSTWTVAMTQSLERGEIMIAVINLGASVFLGLVAAFVGLIVGRSI